MEVVENTPKFCKNTTELVIKYFGDDAVSIYGSGKIGIVSLLSDVQHFIQLFGKDKYPMDVKHYTNILNDIKSVIVNEG